MAKQQPLVRWRAAPAESGRIVAALSHECSASITRRDDAIYSARIGCDGQRPFILIDLFDDPDVARAWVEDKARLLARGIDIAPLRRASS